jgi:hypothetical protein
MMSMPPTLSREPNPRSAKSNNPQVSFFVVQDDGETVNQWRNEMSKTNEPIEEC